MSERDGPATVDVSDTAPRARIRTRSRRRASHRSPGPLAAVGTALRPTGAASVGWFESLVVLVLATLSAFVRVGPTGPRGVVWAEDGSVFLQGAHDHALPAILLKPYAGYAHVVPRTLSEVVSWLPLAWQGVGLVAATALVTGGLALFGYHVLAAHSRRRIAAIVAATAIAAVPVGPEILANLANLQWVLLAAGSLAPFWAPRHRAGQIASIVVVLALVTSCPFGPIAAALCAGIWLLERSRGALRLFLVAVAGSLVQLVVMALAPAREGLAPSVQPTDLVAGWLRRALADGILGTARHDDLDTYLSGAAPSVTAGLILAVVVLALAVLVLARRPGTIARITPVLGLMTASVLTFAAPIVATGTTTGYPLFPGRYYVAPAVLVVVAVGLLADQAWTTSRDAQGIVARAIASALLIAAACGTATSWWRPEDYGRSDGPSWATEVDRARAACMDRPERARVELAIMPESWTVGLTCAELD